MSKVNLPMDVAREISKYNDQTSVIDKLKAENEKLKAENEKLKALCNRVIVENETSKALYNRMILLRERLDVGRLGFHWDDLLRRGVVADPTE